MSAQDMLAQLLRSQGQNDAPRKRPCESEIAVVDMRPLGHFEEWHVAGSVNVPLAEIAHRGFEMPPRGVPILCISDAEDSEDIAEDGKARSLDRHVSLESASAWFTSRVNGNVVTQWGVLPATPALAAQLSAHRLLAKGPVIPGAFLFRACPLVEEELRGSHLAPLLAATSADDASGTSAGEDIRRPRALDVGCGSGRDAAILAAAGFDVLAIDRDSRGLTRLRSLAARHKLECHLSTRVAKLAQEGDLIAAISEQGAFDLVLCARFLHRPTLLELPRLLKPGRGLLLYHTFLDGNKHPTGEEHVFKSGELAQLFSGSCEVLRDDESRIEDGRLLTFFVARRCQTDT